MKQLKRSVFLSASWCIFLFFFGSPIFNLRANLQDHVSNIYSSLLLWSEGPEIYRKGPSEFLDLDTRPESLKWADELGIPHDDILKKRNVENPRPWIIVWPWMPRPYPPGSALFFTPFGLLVEVGVSAYAVFAFCIFTLLVFSHLTFFKIKDELEGHFDDEKDWLRRGFLILINLFLYQELILWGLSGMYDVLALFVLVQSIIFLIHRKWLMCVSFYCFAFFLHYRSLFWAPIPIIALIQWWPLGPGFISKIKSIPFSEKLILSFGLLAALTGLYTFTLTYQSLQIDYLEMKNNPFYLTGLSALKPEIFVGWLLLVGIFCFVMFRKKQWLSITCVLWMTFLLTKMPFVKSWYILFLLPLFFISQKKYLSHHYWHLGLYLYLGGCVFINSPFEFYLWREIIEVIRRN